MSTEHAPSTARTLARRLAGALVVLAALDVIAVVVFRTRWRPGIDAVRRLNRRFLNPAMMRFAGSAHWYASAVHHVGRRSGRAYSTPVVAERVGDHFLIPLPYGTEVDWCANVLAAGGCTLERRGARYRVTAPVIVPASGADGAPARSRRVLRLFGVDAYLRLDLAT